MSSLQPMGCCHMGTLEPFSRGTDKLLFWGSSQARGWWMLGFMHTVLTSDVRLWGYCWALGKMFQNFGVPREQKKHLMDKILKDKILVIVGCGQLDILPGIREGKAENSDILFIVTTFEYLFPPMYGLFHVRYPRPIGQRYFNDKWRCYLFKTAVKIRSAKDIQLVCVCVTL